MCTYSYSSGHARPPCTACPVQITCRVSLYHSSISKHQWFFQTTPPEIYTVCATRLSPSLHADMITGQ
jgi:hypothetical protein